jgi:hypothetical protein
MAKNEGSGIPGCFGVGLWFASVILVLLGINGLFNGYSCIDTACDNSNGIGVVLIVFGVICAGVAFAIGKLRNLD